MGKLTDKREKLIATLHEAEERRSEARFRAQDKRVGVSHDAAQPFAKIHEDIEHKLATPEGETDRLRDATADLIRTVEDKGLVFTAVRTDRNYYALVPVDPAVDTDLQDAERAAIDALEALREFERTNAEKVTAERNKDYAERVQAARDRGDFADAKKLEAEASKVDHRTAAQQTADDLASGKHVGWEDDAKRYEVSVTAPEGATTTAGLGR